MSDNKQQRIYPRGARVRITRTAITFADRTAPPLDAGPTAIVRGRVPNASGDSYFLEREPDGLNLFYTGAVLEPVE